MLEKQYIKLSVNRIECWQTSWVELWQNRKFRCCVVSQKQKQFTVHFITSLIIHSQIYQICNENRNDNSLEIKRNKCLFVLNSIPFLFVGKRNRMTQWVTKPLILDIIKILITVLWSSKILCHSTSINLKMVYKWTLISIDRILRFSFKGISWMIK